MQRMAIMAVSCGYFGPEYEISIGEKTAKKLLSPIRKELPSIGYEIDISSVPRAALKIYNISGQLFVGCAQYKLELWQNVFNFNHATMSFMDSDAG